MPAKIVMVNGEGFVVDMDIDQAASDILVGADPGAKLDVQAGGETKRVYINRQHIAYVEDYVSGEPLAAAGA